MSSEADDEAQNTRPISVAELLARNGTIGAPPVGGRRRRRRGNSEAVTVAELTGEIPVIRDEPPAPEPESVPEDATEAGDAGEAQAPAEDSGEGVIEAESAVDAGEAQAPAEDAGEGVIEAEPAVDAESEVEEPADSVVEVEVITEVEAEVAEQVVEVEVIAEAESEVVAQETTAEMTESVPPLASDPRPRRSGGPELSHDPRPVRRSSGAEQMAFDPVDESVDLSELVGDQAAEEEELRSYLKSSGGTLFSGETVADDLARRGITDDDLPDEGGPPPGPAAKPAPLPGGRTAAVRHGLIAIGQSVLAVILGAGLFIAFDQLWRWNTIVALVLSVLVILGLVVAVRLVRRTEDIASTLIAVVVGALVTLGPLALLQSYG